MMPLVRDRLGQLQTNRQLPVINSRNMRSVGRTLLRNCGAHRCQSLLQQQQGVLRQPLTSRRNIKHAAVEAAAAAETAVDTNSSSTSQQASTAYPFPEIETKWQQYWEENQTFRTPEEVDTSKLKYYVLDMFPYPR